jgi:hypothetical protein
MRSTIAVEGERMSGWTAVAAAAMALGLMGAAPPEASYAEGQVWEYRARAGDEGSLLKIQKIEEVPAFAARGPVYHITIVGVHLGPDAILGALQHAPVSKTTLDASVTRLSKSPAMFPDVEAGIAEWQTSQGGVFDIPVAQIIEVLDQAMRGAPPQG